MTAIRHFALITIILLTALGCKPGTDKGSYTLTTNEKIICDTLGIDTTVIHDIRKFNSNKITPFRYELGDSIFPDSVVKGGFASIKGLTLTDSNNRAYKLVFDLKGTLRKKGYSIIVADNNFGIDNHLDQLAVLKTTDQFEILKQLGTDGINFGITNDSLITIVKRFDKKYALELIGASRDWCEFIIHYEPDSWADLAKEVYKVCPDVVDQGTETVEGLAREMKQNKRLYFWWD